MYCNRKYRYWYISEVFDLYSAPIDLNTCCFRHICSLLQKCLILGSVVQSNPPLISVTLIHDLLFKIRTRPGRFSIDLPGGGLRCLTSVQSPDSSHLGATQLNNFFNLIVFFFKIFFPIGSLSSSRRAEKLFLKSAFFYLLSCFTVWIRDLLAQYSELPALTTCCHWRRCVSKLALQKSPPLNVELFLLLCVCVCALCRIVKYLRNESVIVI